MGYGIWDLNGINGIWDMGFGWDYGSKGGWEWDLGGMGF